MYKQLIELLLVIVREEYFMRNIDKDGLLVCSIQGKVFLNSLTISNVV